MSEKILDYDFNDEERNHRLATFWTRLWASLVDLLVLLPLTLLSFYVLLSLKSIPIMVLLSLITWVYKPLLEYQYGATVGKMALKIKVVDENFGMITGGQAMTRFLPWIISYVLNLVSVLQIMSIPGFQNIEGFMEYLSFVQENPTPMSTIGSLAGWLVIISVIPIFFNATKQAIHDKLAKTYVIHND